jgi:hypothetical protein
MANLSNRVKVRGTGSGYSPSPPEPYEVQGIVLHSTWCRACPPPSKRLCRNIKKLTFCLPRPRSEPGPVGRGDEPVMKDFLEII